MLLPVGMLEMIDDTEVDHKIVAVPLRNPRFDQTITMDESPDNVSPPVPGALQCHLFYV